MWDEMWDAFALALRGIRCNAFEVLKFSNCQCAGFGFVIFYFYSMLGLVLTRSSICFGWIHSTIWCPRMSSSFMLLNRFIRTCRKWNYDRPNVITLQLCILCFSCGWKQVSSVYSLNLLYVQMCAYRSIHFRWNYYSKWFPNQSQEI